MKSDFILCDINMVLYNLAFPRRVNEHDQQMLNISEAFIPEAFIPEAYSLVHTN